MLRERETRLNPFYTRKDVRYRLTATASSATRTLTLADYGRMIPCDSASQVDVRVPENASVALPVETEIVIARLGTGVVSVSPVSGAVTILCPATPALRAQGSVATLKKIDTDTWLLMGDLDTVLDGGSYTPVVSGTGWSAGSGQIVGNYQVIGDYCTFNAFITFGSGATFGGSALRVSLPVAANSNVVGTSKQPIVATYTDTGTTQYFGRARIFDSTTLLAKFPDNTTGEALDVISTVPHTWAETDIAFFTGTYWIA